MATAKFIWFGTTHIFDGLTFVHRESEHGTFAVHGYPISDELSTFIVETDEETWRRAGMDEFDVSQPPGPSDTASQEFLEKLFAEDIGGAPLVTNNSRWGNFRTRRTQRWYRDNVVLLGDAVHTAHFSVGSGTKMAMEDAIVLARELASSIDDDVSTAFERYEAERQPEVAKIQNAAGPSLSWWEHFGFYYEHLAPLDFAFHFFSRSIDIERIRRRDPALADQVDAAWMSRHGSTPLQSELSIGSTRFEGRRLNVRHDDTGVVLVDPVSGRRLDSGVAIIAAPLDQHEAALVDLPEWSTVVVIHEGTALTRSLVAERVRLANDQVAVIIDDDLSDSDVATLILSGRADAVATREEAHATA
jgi:anthraniloyl-CoA monooxygenase